LHVNDILRVHRAQVSFVMFPLSAVGFYQNERALIVKVGSFGCHAASWRGDFDVPLQLTSSTCTMSKQDSIRLHTLRRWLRTKETSVHPSSDHPPEPSSNNIPADVSNQQIFASIRRTAPQTTRLCPTISSAVEIPVLGSKFFNWYAQVLGVYRAKGDVFAVFLRVWDGTKPKFAAYRNMFHADSDSIEATYCEIQKFLLCIIEGYIIDVCCYGDWARKAMELKADSVSSIVSETLYFWETYVITRCADALSLYCGTNSALLATPKGGKLMRLFSEEPQARSTPKANLNSFNVVKEKETTLVDQMLPRNSSDSSDLTGISSPCITQIEDQISTEVLNSEGDSIVEDEAVIFDQCIDDICDDSVFHLEILRLLNDLVQRNLSKSEEVLRITAFRNKIKQKLLETLFEKKLAELDEMETGEVELVEEMEEILKMNVGDHVDFVNFVEAELSVLKQPDYLRNALLFTGKCVSCGEEVIVERRSKHWCRKCFTEKNELSSTRYSYRILVPSVYLRSDGQLAQLCLAIAGDIWVLGVSNFIWFELFDIVVASLSTGSDRLSVSKVVELYSEEVFETFIRKLNHVILLAEAIMKKQKFSVIDGKIIALDRSNGSISMFVDRCMIAKREC
uniref:Run domain Beclin-1 interacting and cysteine-rich containing protein n=1 Tax=Angiostrongylus cantonensis TaxID=6313 RepID=A0A0K0DJQ0_ANGCA